MRIVLALAAAFPLTFGAISAQAMPAGMAMGSNNGAEITLVRNGCGIGYNRGPLGYCRPNGFPVRSLNGALGGGCPPTYHLGPFGQRCRSNY